MKISSLKDLLYATATRSASISSVDEFYTSRIPSSAGAFAYFAKDIAGVMLALERSAYVIVVDFDIDIDSLAKDMDKSSSAELWCLKVDDISAALCRLAGYLANDASFYHCSKIQLSFAKKLGLCTLSGDIFADFANILRAKVLLSSDLEYISSISTPSTLKVCEYEIIHSSNFFHTSFKLKNTEIFHTDLFGSISDIYLCDVVLPRELVGEFCALYPLAKKTATMMDYYYLDELGMLTDSSRCYRCVVLLDDEYEQMREIYPHMSFALSFESMLECGSEIVFLKMPRQEFLDKIMSIKHSACLFESDDDK